MFNYKINKSNYEYINIIYIEITQTKLYILDFERSGKCIGFKMCIPIYIYIFYNCFTT